jgi:hypothetical protein
MRILGKIVLVVVLIVTLLILWLWRGRDLTILLDRFRTIETSSLRIKNVRYEGSGTSGLLHLDDLALGLNIADTREAQPNIGTTKDDQLALSFAGKVFAFGRVHTTSENENLSANVPTGDNATVSMEHSVLPWPIPFDFNFMSGQSPTWRRYLYYRLNWQKPDRAKLKMIWRYEEYFYSGNGWMNSGMSYEKSTGLIRVEISNPLR